MFDLRQLVLRSSLRVGLPDGASLQALWLWDRPNRNPGGWEVGFRSSEHEEKVNRGMLSLSLLRISPHLRNCCLMDVRGIDRVPAPLSSPFPFLRAQ